MEGWRWQLNQKWKNCQSECQVDRRRCMETVWMVSIHKDSARWCSIFRFRNKIGWPSSRVDGDGGGQLGCLSHTALIGSISRVSGSGICLSLSFDGVSWHTLCSLRSYAVNLKLEKTKRITSWDVFPSTQQIFRRNGCRIKNATTTNKK